MTEHLADRVGFANVDPIFMAHRVNDMIPITRAITSRRALMDLAYQAQWQEYAMGHQVCPQQITHIGQWLNSVTPLEGSIEVAGTLGANPLGLDTLRAGRFRFFPSRPCVCGKSVRDGAEHGFPLPGPDSVSGGHGGLGG